MQIVPFGEKYREAWDTFLKATPGAVFEHQAGWKDVIENVFNHKGYHHLAMENGDVTGVFPLYFVEHMLFGRFLISIPYCSSTGGIVYRTAQARDALLHRAVEIAGELNADYMEIRNHREKYPGLLNKDYYYTLTLDLSKGIDTIWKQLSRKTRYYIRRAYRAGFEIRRTMTSLADFHGVYVENMRDLGTPAWKYDFLEEIAKTFPESVNLITVYLGRTCVGGILLFGFREMCSDPWASSLRSYFHLYPNYLLYWEAIKTACENGHTLYDFGRSTYDSGTFFFKKRFGGVPMPVYYQYYLPPSKKGEIPNVDPHNPAYRLGIRIWRNLPVFAARRLGHMLIRGIP